MAFTVTELTFLDIECASTNQTLCMLTLLILVGRQWHNSLLQMTTDRLMKTTLRMMQLKITPRTMMPHSLKSKFVKWKTVEVWFKLDHSKTITQMLMEMKEILTLNNNKFRKTKTIVLE